MLLLDGMMGRQPVFKRPKNNSTHALGATSFCGFLRKKRPPMAAVGDGVCAAFLSRRGSRNQLYRMHIQLYRLDAKGIFLARSCLRHLQKFARHGDCLSGARQRPPIQSFLRPVRTP